MVLRTIKGRLDLMIQKIEEQQRGIEENKLYLGLSSDYVQGAYGVLLNVEDELKTLRADVERTLRDEGFVRINVGDERNEVREYKR